MAIYGYIYGHSSSLCAVAFEAEVFSQTIEMLFGAVHDPRLKELFNSLLTSMIAKEAENVGARAMDIGFPRDFHGFSGIFASFSRMFNDFLLIFMDSQ